MEAIADVVHEPNHALEDVALAARCAAATLPIDAAALTETCAALLATARGGSLLLTDLEHLPAIVQNRLLETFARLQAARAVPCHVRLIAGTTTTL